MPRCVVGGVERGVDAKVRGWRGGRGEERERGQLCGPSPLPHGGACLSCPAMPACAACRYCPSIEDKIVRFADKESHQIFLEPESRSTPELYVQVGGWGRAGGCAGVGRGGCAGG
jgi:hypothetical protein